MILECDLHGRASNTGTRTGQHGNDDDRKARLLSTTEPGDPRTPRRLTGNEAGQLIERVFTDHGISLESDVPPAFHWSESDSVVFEADGFNDSLQVGYEYYDFENDPAVLSNEAVHALAASVDGEGPDIKLVASTERSSDCEINLELQIERSSRRSGRTALFEPTLRFDAPARRVAPPLLHLPPPGPGNSYHRSKSMHRATSEADDTASKSDAESE